MASDWWFVVNLSPQNASPHPFDKGRCQPIRKLGRREPPLHEDVPFFRKGFAGCRYGLDFKCLASGARFGLSLLQRSDMAPYCGTWWIFTINAIYSAFRTEALHYRVQCRVCLSGGGLQDFTA